MHFTTKRGIVIVGLTLSVCQSVCLSDCNVRALWLNRLMFSENSVTTNWPRDLAHYTILLIDRTLAKHLQILGENERGRPYVQVSGICNTKPAMSLKRSGLEPNLV